MHRASFVKSLHLVEHQFPLAHEMEVSQAHRAHFAWEAGSIVGDMTRRPKLQVTWSFSPSFSEASGNFSQEVVYINFPVVSVSKLGSMSLSCILNN